MSASIEFYNVKKKAKVKISPAKVEKVTYDRTLKDGKVQRRFAFKAVDDDGTKLTKFCSEKDWNAL
ncbi:MAG: hypothetical protein EXS67_01730 [Candidatus Margulisbacteria bacterium]|nr:hypothetical protein [Candidatus Margulisiibacteriota bacterium]